MSKVNKFQKKKTGKLPRCEQPVDGNIFLLADAPGSFTGLRIGRRIPIGIVDDDAIGTSEVDAEAANFGGEQKDENAVVPVEAFDHGQPGTDWSGAIHSRVGIALGPNVVFQHAQHLETPGNQK